MWSGAWNCASLNDSRSGSWRKRRSLQPSIESLSFRSGMSILTDSASSAVFRDGHIIIAMDSGAKIRFPVAENPRLTTGTAEQLSRIEISAFDVHWADLEEDLSFRGLLGGGLWTASESRTTQSSEQPLTVSFLTLPDSMSCDSQNQRARSVAVAHSNR